VNLLERVGLDEEFPTIPRTVGWGKLYSSGTLGMGMGTRVTMRVVVTTPLTVILSLDTESKPPPLLDTLTSTPLWSGTSVMGLTRRARGGRDRTTRASNG
jgi:hypothetical protein